jgi:hypothetical protein
MGKKRAGAPCKSETQLWTAARPAIDVGWGYLLRLQVLSPVAAVVHGRRGCRRVGPRRDAAALVVAEGPPPCGTSRDAAALVVAEGPLPRETLRGQLPLWWSSRGRRHVGPLAGPLPLWWSPRGCRRRVLAMVVAGAAVPHRPCTATAWESARECRRRPSPCSTVEIPRQGPPRSSSVGVLGQRCGERIRRERGIAVVVNGGDG